MINQISWNDYFYFVCLFLVTYYLIVAAFFFRVEIADILAGKYFQQKDQYNESKSEDISNSSIQVVSQIENTLKQYGANARKDVLLTELRAALKGYAGMKIPAYRNAILDYAVREARQVCGVEISVIELEK